MIKFKLLPTLQALFFCFFSSMSGAAEILRDGFESGNMSMTNSDGFDWDSNNMTAIVTTEPNCGGYTSGQPVLIYNNGVLCKPKTSGIEPAKNGKNSLRFRYKAGEEWSEQRFFLNSFYPDIWVAYWIRVPSNYSRGKNQTGGGKNNKWFDIMWGRNHGDYVSDGPRVEMQDYPSSNSSNMSIKIQLRQTEPHGFKNSSSYADFITPADAGRWMHVVYQGVSGNGNGAFRFWRRWGNEESYELINEINNAFITTGANGYPGWGYGYIFGYANMPYASNTDWFLDDFVVATHPLFLDTKVPKIPVVDTNVQ